MRLALLLLVACGAAERPCSSPAPEIKRVVERVPCLNMPPPLRPDRDPDPGLDRAQLGRYGETASASDLVRLARKNARRRRR